MKTHVLIYDGYVSFEIMLAIYLMKTKGEIITVGISSNPVKSYEGLRVNPEQLLDEVNDGDIEAFIIPGGDISEIQQNEKLVSLLQKMNTDHKYIGAICSGVDLIKQAGLLEGKKYTSNDASHTATYEVHDNLITAKANGYVDFAIALGQMRGIYSDEADYEETIRFFKYFEND
ncbi:DJ-1/PfpI family protein [Paenibacillus silvae]|uniref:DJ-1/PfpI family protein n=1 Tax=Paenibacillus silvae TaxID=1325358 RepID=UPI0011A4C2A7|nr:MULTISPECIES: DJ-1/PfpI family protein [Paenibacillus]MCK6075206.1 DJ-1/PfpI family protein [Paenibacillus silvae]MCK6149593.1 DJ-1/PfpI family protein [Paenibacillus silvae]MCK6267891.1 DJ-1/PfpI family protein [Paenibacillus silvae]